MKNSPQYFMSCLLLTRILPRYTHTRDMLLTQIHTFCLAFIAWRGACIHACERDLCLTKPNSTVCVCGGERWHTTTTLFIGPWRTLKKFQALRQEGSNIHYTLEIESLRMYSGLARKTWGFCAGARLVPTASFHKSFYFLVCFLKYQGSCVILL